MKRKYFPLLILVLIALIMSIILSSNTVTEEFCPLEPVEGGCNSVSESDYSETFGIQNSHYGIIIFSILSLMILFQIFKPKRVIRNSINFAFIFGSIFAGYFIYLQVFVIKTFCAFCMATDISLLIGLIITLIYWKK